MSPHPVMTENGNFAESFVRAVIYSLLGLGSLMGAGCASMSMDGPVTLETASQMSPLPTLTSLSDATRQAKSYVAAHAGAQIALGSGDSMLPLYKNNTVIVVAPAPMSALHRGMTVVFVSSEGWPVAHVLVEKRADGWVTMGLHNSDYDAHPMNEANYVGVVARAYQVDENPMLALARTLSADPETAIAMAEPASALIARTP